MSNAKKLWTLDENSQASLPGNLRINPFQWISHASKYPIYLLLGLIFFGLLTSYHWLFFIPTLLLVRKNFYYWQRIKEHFSFGCVNASVVVSEEPIMFAVATNLSKTSSWDYPVIKIIKAPLKTAAGQKVTIGTRFPSVAVYSRGNQNELSHWVDFMPLPVDYATSSRKSIQNMMSRLSDNDWNELDEWLKTIPLPLKPGLYPVDIQKNTPSKANNNQQAISDNVGMNDFATHVLSAISQGNTIPFSFMYRNQFEKLHLDFSLNSLEKMDALLQEIRHQLKPTYDSIVNNGEGRLFLNIVTIYVMATIAKAGGYTVKWFDYDEFKAMVHPNQPPEYCFESTFICVMNGAIRISLGITTDILFQNPVGMGFVEYANKILKEPTDYSQHYTELNKMSLSDNMTLELSGDLLLNAQPLINLSECLGVLIAGTIAHAPSGNFGVTLLAPSLEKEQLKMSFIKFMDNDAPEMQSHLANNPRQKEWLVGAFDGFVYPYSGKTDAIILEARSYIDNIKINIYLPYKHDEANNLFTFAKPMLIGNWSAIEVEVISKSMLKQIHQMPIATEAWQKYFNINI